MAQMLLSTVLAFLVLYVPGAIALIRSGLPPLLVAAIAPALSACLADLSGVLAALFGVRWGWWWLLGASIVAGAVIALLSARTTRRVAWRSWPAWGQAFVFACVLAAAVFGWTVYGAVSRDFTVVPQDFDPTFHANTIRWLATEGVATSDGLAPMNSFGSERGTYYPMALHALASLVAPAAPGGVLGAFHGVNMAWPLMLPLGAAALSRALGLGAVAAGTSALVSTLFTSLPWELLWRGLFPFIFSLAALTGALALLLVGAAGRRLVDALILMGVCSGMVAVHTSAVASIALLGLVVAVGSLMVSKQRLATLAWFGLVAVLLAAAMLPVALALGLGSGAVGGGIGGVDWPAVQTPQQAIRSAWGFGTGYRPEIQLRIAVLVWFGVLASLVPGRRRALFLLPGMLGAMGLYVAAAAYDTPWSLSLTALWWNDQLRLGALAAVFAPLFVGVGADAVAAGIALVIGRLRRSSPSAEGPLAPSAGIPTGVAVAAGVLAAVLASGVGWIVFKDYHRRAYDAVHFMYYPAGEAVSTGEVEAMERVAETIPQCVLVEMPDRCRVMNDPADGSPWLFALEGIRPVFLHAFQATPGSERDVLMRRFDELGTDPQVRALAREYHVDYAFVTQGFLLGHGPRITGLDNLDQHPEAFELLWRTDTSSLYRVRWEKLPNP